MLNTYVCLQDDETLKYRKINDLIDELKKTGNLFIDSKVVDHLKPDQEIVVELVEYSQDDKKLNKAVITTYDDDHNLINNLFNFDQYSAEKLIRDLIIDPEETIDFLFQENRQKEGVK